MTQIPKPSLDEMPVKRRSRFVEKISTVGAIFVMNLALFLFLGSYVVYHIITAQAADPLVFVKTKALPPPPKPPAKGGEASRSLADPSTLIVPPTVAPPSVIVSTMPSNISFKAEMSSVSTTLSTPSFATPSGSGMASGTTGGGHSMASPFGDAGVTGSPGLVGELYDLKQTPAGTPTPIAIVPPESADSYYGAFQTLPATKEAMKVLRSYVKGWDQSVLDQYYKSPVMLNATQIFIPTRRSEEATKAFQVDDKVVARRWVAHYHGTIMPPKGGRFRFLGFGDDFLVVRVGDQNVLDGSFPGETLDQSADEKDEGIPGPDGHHLAVGKWVDFESGIPTSIDILIGEGPGGYSGFVLLVEEEGDTSAKGDYPVFQVASTPVNPWNNYPSVFTSKALVFGAQ